MAQRHTTSLTLRLRYRVDNLVAGGTGALIGWFALACLAVVVPASTVLVWSDRAAPATLSGRLAAVWVSVGQTLKLGARSVPRSTYWPPWHSRWSPCCSCPHWSV